MKFQDLIHNNEYSVDERLIQLRSHLVKLHKVLQHLKKKRCNHKKLKNEYKLLVQQYNNLKYTHMCLRKRYYKISKKNRKLIRDKKKRNLKYQKYKKLIHQFKSGALTSFIYLFLIFINKHMSNLDKIKIKKTKKKS